MRTILVLLLAANSYALDCTTPPTSGFGSGYAAYAQWCTACGGTPSSAGGVSCKPGPNWGTQGGSSGHDALAGQAGELIREMVFGDPEEDRQKEQVVQQAKTAGDERNAEENASRDEIKERLAGEMKFGERTAAQRAPRPAFARAASSQTKIIQCARSPDGKFRSSATQFVCTTLTCGGTDRVPICCPASYPILNECECRCHQDTAFSCQRYSACRHTQDPK